LNRYYLCYGLVVIGGYCNLLIDFGMLV
jgi:hypothetical protein